MTWAALLGRWVQFAQSALALPQDRASQPWRQAVPDIITMQALCMALEQADELAIDEHALALDRARLLFRRHHQQLEQCFAGPPEHPMLIELIDQAREAIAKAEASFQQRTDATPSPQEQQL